MQSQTKNQLTSGVIPTAYENQIKQIQDQHREELAHLDQVYQKKFDVQSMEVEALRNSQIHMEQQIKKLQNERHTISRNSKVSNTSKSRNERSTPQTQFGKVSYRVELQRPSEQGSMNEKPSQGVDVCLKVPSSVNASLPFNNASQRTTNLNQRESGLAKDSMPLRQNISIPSVSEVNNSQFLNPCDSNEQQVSVKDEAHQESRHDMFDSENKQDKTPEQPIIGTSNSPSPIKVEGSSPVIMQDQAEDDSILEQNQSYEKQTILQGEQLKFQPNAPFFSRDKMQVSTEDHGKRSLLVELEKFVLQVNTSAMELLKQNNPKDALEMLTKAEYKLVELNQSLEFYKNQDQFADQDWSQSNFNLSIFSQIKGADTEVESLKNKLFGLTYNNFGCIYKQQQDLPQALASLKQALVYESLEEQNCVKQGKSHLVATVQSNSAGTILNICAILSRLNQHQQAAEYAYQAVIKLHEARDFLSTQLELANNQCQSLLQESGTSPSETQFQSIQSQKKGYNELFSLWKSVTSTSAIAHYNAGVELEFLRLWPEALSQYEQSHPLAVSTIGQHSPLCRKIERAIKKMRMNSKIQDERLECRPLQSQFIDSALSIGKQRLIFGNRRLKDQEEQIFSNDSSPLMLANLPDILNISNRKKDVLHCASVFHKQNFNKLTDSFTQGSITNCRNSIGNVNTQTNESAQKQLHEDSIYSTIKDQESFQEKDSTGLIQNQMPLNKFKPELSLNQIVERLDKQERGESPRFPSGAQSPQFGGNLQVQSQSKGSSVHENSINLTDQEQSMNMQFQVEKNISLCTDVPLNIIDNFRHQSCHQSIRHVSQGSNVKRKYSPKKSPVRDIKMAFRSMSIQPNLVQTNDACSTFQSVQEEFSNFSQTQTFKNPYLPNIGRNKKNSKFQTISTRGKTTTNKRRNQASPDQKVAKMRLKLNSGDGVVSPRHPLINQPAINLHHMRRQANMTQQQSRKHHEINTFVADLTMDPTACFGPRNNHELSSQSRTVSPNTQVSRGNKFSRISHQQGSLKASSRSNSRNTENIQPVLSPGQLKELLNSVEEKKTKERLKMQLQRDLEQEKLQALAQFNKSKPNNSSILAVSKRRSSIQPQLRMPALKSKPDYRNAYLPKKKINAIYRGKVTKEMQNKSKLPNIEEQISNLNSDSQFTSQLQNLQEHREGKNDSAEQILDLNQFINQDEIAGRFSSNIEKVEEQPWLAEESDRSLIGGGISPIQESKTQEPLVYFPPSEEPSKLVTQESQRHSTYVNKKILQSDNSKSPQNSPKKILQSDNSKSPLNSPPEPVNVKIPNQVHSLLVENKPQPKAATPFISISKGPAEMQSEENKKQMKATTPVENRIQMKAKTQVEDRIQMKAKTPVENRIQMKASTPFISQGPTPCVAVTGPMSVVSETDNTQTHMTQQDMMCSHGVVAENTTSDQQSIELVSSKLDVQPNVEVVRPRMRLSPIASRSIATQKMRQPSGPVGVGRRQSSEVLQNQRVVGQQKRVKDMLQSQEGGLKKINAPISGSGIIEGEMTSSPKETKANYFAQGYVTKRSGNTFMNECLSNSNETKTEMLSRIRNQNLKIQGKSSPRRQMNHKASQESSNSELTTEVNMNFNIQHQKKRDQVKVGNLGLQGNQLHKNNKFSTSPARSSQLSNSPKTQGGKSSRETIQRYKKVTGKIETLNMHLKRFQAAITLQKDDPILKSTERDSTYRQ